VFGYTQSEAIGQLGAFLYIPEDRQANVPETELSRARAASSIAEEHWQVRKDGTRFWSEGTLSPQADATGKIMGSSR